MSGIKRKRPDGSDKVQKTSFSSKHVRVEPDTQLRKINEHVKSSSRATRENVEDNDEMLSAADTSGSDGEEPVTTNSIVKELPAADEIAVDTPTSIKTFKELGLADELQEACDRLKFKYPTPIQTQTIPIALQGRDIIGLAETGSGKTAAFALPILQALLENQQPLFALVLAPTRELAIQTAQTFSALGSGINLRVAQVVGGMDKMQQAIALQKNPHVIVATPGRLLDHLKETKGFSLRKLRYLVLDEGDRLLDMGFKDEILAILKNLPQERKTYLFSATISSDIDSLQRASLKHPVRISVNKSTTELQTVAQLLQYYVFVPHIRRDIYLVHILSNLYPGHSTIVFARTVNEVNRVTYMLRALGLGAIPIHGQLSQSSRLSALNKFKARSRDVLVATDVAARGLDIPNVDLVVNHDLPDDSATYVHRVGRTARAGKSGRAINMVTQYTYEVYKRIEGALRTEFPALQGCEKDAVMVLSNSVGEAQRVAVRQARDEKDKKSQGMRGKRKVAVTRDERDRDEG